MPDDDIKPTDDSPAPDDKPTPSDDGSLAAIEQMNNVIGGLTQTMANIQAAVADLQSGRKDDPEPKPAEVSLDGLEDLDRTQFATRILEAVKAGQDIRDSRIQSALERLDEKLSSNNARTDVERTADKNEDFWEWKSEMQQIAKENPGMSATRVYKLARAENPEKASKMDAKYKPKDTPKDEPEDKGSKSKIFGGLEPTSGKSAKATDMSAADAAEAAWEATMLDVGDILNST